MTRSSIAASCKRSISLFFAIALTVGLMPASALASEEGEGASPSLSEDASSLVGADAPAQRAPRPADVIDRDVALTTVAQAESTKSFFLAQTLESTRTVPMVSAKLPIDSGTDGEGSGSEGIDPVEGVSAGSIVVGAFEQDGMTFAIEAEGGSVALMAIDYAKLPRECVSKQVVVIPETVSSDGIDSFSVARIGSGAFSSLKKESADPAFAGCEVLFSDEELLAEAGIDPSEVEGFLSDDDAASAMQDDEEAIVSSDAQAGADAREDGSDPSAEEGVSAGPDGAEKVRSIVSMEGDVATLDDGSTYEFKNPLAGCAGILAAYIPASVTQIEDDVFSGSDTLQYLVVADDNQTYASFDGALYSADLATLRLIPEGRVGAVRIAPSAAEASPEALSHCASVDALVVDAGSAAYESMATDGLPDIFLSSSGAVNDVSGGRASAVLRALSAYRVSDSVFGVPLEERNGYRATSYYTSCYRQDGTTTFETIIAFDDQPYPKPTMSTSRPGYRFLGVFSRPGRQLLDSSLNAVSNWSKSLDGTEIDYRWEALPVKTSCYRQDETKAYESIYAYDGQSYPKPTMSLDRPGYRFVGVFSRPGHQLLDANLNMVYTWRYERDGTEIDYRWEAVPLLTSCYRNDGTTAFESINAYDLQPYPKPTMSLERPGYRFLGVFSRPGHHLLDADLNTVNVWRFERDGREIDYKWEAVPVLTSCYRNDGTDAYESIEAKDSQSYPQPTMSLNRVGYDFLGVFSRPGHRLLDANLNTVNAWKYERDGLEIDYKWTPHAYTVSFEGNGAGASVSPSSVTAVYDTDLTLPSATRHGYDFLGWNTKPDGTGTSYAAGVHRNLSSKDGATVILYARWKIHENTVSWTDRGSALGSETVAFGSPVLMREAPEERAAHEFVGWKASSDGSVHAAGSSDFAMPDADVAFEAVWRLEPCTFVFDPGTGDEGELSVLLPTPDPESPIEVPVPVARGRGEVFSHWGTAPDDQERAWLPGEELGAEELFASGYPESAVVDSETIAGVARSNVIRLHAVWAEALSVEVPLEACVALDPQTGETIAAEGRLSVTSDAEVEVVGLAFDKTDGSSAGGGTDAVLGPEAAGVSLEVRSIGSGEGEGAFDDAVVLAVPLASETVVTGEELASCFPRFGSSRGYLRVRYDLAFAEGTDPSSLSLPERDSEGGTSSERYPIARLHYTVALAR